MNETMILVKFMLKRDKFKILFTILGLLLFTIAISFEYSESSTYERQAMAMMMKNPAMLAIQGPGLGLENGSVGAMLVQNSLILSAIFVSAINIFTMVKHTRTDEELGRLELIRSFPVGKSTVLIATVLTSLVLNLLIALVLVIALPLVNGDYLDIQGSLMYGLSLGIIGMFFATLTSVIVQFFENPKKVLNWSFLLLIVFYLLRALGDVNDNFLAWLSPLGITSRIAPFTDNNFQPAIILVLLSLILIPLALKLNELRDLGSGFIQQNYGKASASEFLISRFGLILKLEAKQIFIWGFSLLAMGIVYGSVLGNVEEFFNSLEVFANLFDNESPNAQVYSFITFFLSIFAIIIAVPCLNILLAVKTEEKRNRLEHLFSRDISRKTVVHNYLIVSVVSSVIFTLIASLSLFGASHLVLNESLSFTSVLTSSLSYLPAIWAMVMIALVLIGVSDRYSNLVWLLLIFNGFISILGNLFPIADWVRSLSFFYLVPQLMMEDFNLLSIFILLSLTTVFYILGMKLYQKRDITG